ncbi:MAG: hypothetical protein CM1200mP39_30920 [Dehalococcoidia bacterium]|nr:MAG: hypothetical protein CM1200mP39_30920 [Dehalococcoidia bacterium]
MKADATLRDDLKLLPGLNLSTRAALAKARNDRATYDSEASAVAAQPRIQAIFGEMAEFMTSPPEVKKGECHLDDVEVQTPHGKNPQSGAFCIQQGVDF